MRNAFAILVVLVGIASSICWAQQSPEIIPQLGHSDEVLTIRFSPRGDTVLSAGLDKLAILWDLKSRRQVRSFNGHSWHVMSAAFSTDGARLITGSSDYTARIWNTATGQTEAVLRGHNHWVTAVAFSPDGNMALTGSEDSTARLWDLRTPGLTHMLRQHKGGVNAVAFALDGKHFATGGFDGEISVYDESGSNEIRRLSMKRPIEKLSFSPNGGMLASADERGDVVLWNISSGGVIFSMLDRNEPILFCGFSRDGSKLLLSSKSLVIQAVDLGLHTIGQEVLAASDERIVSVAISPDERFAVTGSETGVLKLWDLRSGRFERNLIGEAVDVSSTKVSREPAVCNGGSCRFGIWKKEVK